MTPLSYALLGLIRMEPRSGYALRKVFETTPLGNYSSSPGSIYPALKTLEKVGMIDSRPSTARKTQFHITPAGSQVLDSWLAQPVAPGENTDVSLLRFALLQAHPDRSLTLNFLRSFALAARNHIVGLKAFMAGNLHQSMPLQSRLAVQYGLRATETAAEWAADAYKQLSEEINR